MRSAHVNSCEKEVVAQRPPADPWEKKMAEGMYAFAQMRAEAEKMTKFTEEDAALWMSLC